MKTDLLDVLIIYYNTTKILQSLVNISTGDLLDAVKSRLEINLGCFKSKLVLAQGLQLTAAATHTTE